MATPEEQMARPDAKPGYGYLSEMFCSIQGEGPFVGERQVFVRTAGCSATCSWCDTVYSKVLTPRFVVYGDEAAPFENPVAIDTAAAEVIDFSRRNQPVQTISITGGEPLEQPEFVTELARRIHSEGLRVYLETNGVHAVPLAGILPYVHVIAMDIKLPSAVGVDMWEDHSRFLSVLRGSEFLSEGNTGRSIFVKVVMDANSGLDEVEKAVGIVAAASPSIQLVLQPESETLLSPKTPRETARALLEKMKVAQGLALKTLKDVRVMPQLHKILKVR